MISKTVSLLSLRDQCDLLSIPRSSYYYESKGESTLNLDLMKHMDEHHLEHPTHGGLQMQDYLLGLGYHVNIKRVRRLMRLMDINVIWPKPILSKLGSAKYKYPYLLRKLKITHPNHVWQIDITYIPMKHGFMYLTAIIDVYSRSILGWNLSNTLDAVNSISVFKSAVEQYGAPKIMNSDQGSQYTSEEWVTAVKKHFLIS